MKISLKLINQYMAIFFNYSPTLNHLHPLQVENCDSNSRLVVDEMTMVNSGSKGLRQLIQIVKLHCGVNVHYIGQIIDSERSNVHISAQSIHS